MTHASLIWSLPELKIIQSLSQKSLKYCTSEGSLGWCETCIQSNQKEEKKKAEWKQQYIIHMYRNKTVCVSNVDFNLHSFCVGHIFRVFNFLLAIYTAFFNFLWLCLSWTVVLLLSTLLQLGIFGRGKKRQNTYSESKVLHPLLDQLYYSRNAWKERHQFNS